MKKLLFTVLASALLLSGCGGGDSDSDSSGNGAAVETPPAPTTASTQ